jgi:hypothetical protein
MPCILGHVCRRHFFLFTRLPHFVLLHVLWSFSLKRVFQVLGHLQVVFLKVLLRCSGKQFKRESPCFHYQGRHPSHEMILEVSTRGRQLRVGGGRAKSFVTHVLPWMDIRYESLLNQIKVIQRFPYKSSVYWWVSILMHVWSWKITISFYSQKLAL